jgi:hypothetical protein
MRRLALLLALSLAPVFAQVDVSKLITGNPNSPEAIAAASFGQGKTVWIFYHAPSIRDPKTKQPRHIFGAAGALQPNGTVWRLGADYATLLHTDVDLDINGLTVPKGDYTLYVDLDGGKWKLIVNKQLMNAQGTRFQWGIADAKGTTTNDPAKEVGRTDLTMGKPASPVETLKISLTRTDATHGKLEIAWENTTASAPITVK